jgi:GH15 family glucan-1,4-alpha-glucosidase
VTLRAALTATTATFALAVMGAPAYGAEHARRAQADMTPVATQEAENATLAEADVSTRFPDFNGTGYVYSNPGQGNAVTFSVDVPANNFYTLQVRYANGGGHSAWRSLAVDGADRPKAFKFQQQWSWATWRTTEVSTYLRSGHHTVGIVFRAGDRGPLAIDALSVLARTAPANTSTTSQLMNNWDDLVAIAQSAKLYPKDTDPYGPTLAELHYKGDWPTNQLRSEASYVHGITDRPDRFPPSWDTNLFFDTGGVLHQEYLDQRAGLRGLDKMRSASPVQIVKDYVVVPQRHFVVVRYRMENLTGQQRSFDFMDHVELNNKQVPNETHPSDTGAVETQTADWDGTRNGYLANMSRTGQFWFAQGSFQPMDSHAAGSYKAGPSYPGNPFQDVVRDFRDGTLSNTTSSTARLLSVGVARHITLDPYASTSLSFVYTVQGTRDAATAAVDTALGQSAESWAQRTRSVYGDWLSRGQRGTQLDPGVNQAFDISLITLKQSQQPEFGSWVAATSPAYEYKVWPRDAAVTALSMDAAGHHEEAGRYFRWMASVIQPEEPDPIAPQLLPGSWYTNYGFWQARQPIRFVEPEFDSTGLFLVGVWRHYQALAATDTAAARDYITDPVIANAIRLGGHFIADHIDEHGFGPPDQSIWEERFEIATFTQATYAAGLRAASRLRRAVGAGVEADAWAQGAETIRAAILRPTNDPEFPGLWRDPTQGGEPPEGCFATGVFHGPNCYGPFPSTGDPAPYFIRGIYPTGTLGGNPTPQLDSEVDSSTGLLWVLGLIDANDPKAVAHRAKMLRWLGRNDFGISRHEEDDFYYSSIYSPGGRFEANEPSPEWPQPVMYMSMLERWQGMNARAGNRLQWYASVAPYGYEPPGEAVDWTTEEPLVSTASEPVTGAWFQLATLVNQGSYDPRLWP